MDNLINEEKMIQARDQLQTRLDALDEERTDIARQLTAINLYLNAMKGVLPQTEPAVADVQAQADKPHQRRTSGTRAPKGERREAILEILRKELEGSTLDKIAETLGVADDPDQKKNIYATLQNMKSKGVIIKKPDKRYAVPPAEEQEPQPGPSEAG
jgi:hypothetical protein